MSNERDDYDLIPTMEDLNNKFRKVAGKVLDAYYNDDEKALRIIGGPHFVSQAFKTIGSYICNENKIAAYESLSASDDMDSNLKFIEYSPLEKQIQKIVDKIEEK